MNIPGSFNEGWGVKFRDSFGGIAPAATGPVLPAWVTHAWEDPGVADGAPITTHTDLISAVVAASSGTARPTWREDYAGTGVAAVEWDGVDDVLTTTTNVDLTAGYTYCALVYIQGFTGGLSTLFEQGGAATESSVYGSSTYSNMYLVRRVGGTFVVGTPSPYVPSGQWLCITVTHNGAASNVTVNRVVHATGSVPNPSVSGIIRFGHGIGAISLGWLKGAVAAHYFGPPASPTQLTEIWDYVNDRHGVSL